MAIETIDLARQELLAKSVPPPPAQPQRTRALELLLVMSVAFAPLIVNSAFALWKTPDNSFLQFRIASLILHECISLAVFFYVLSQQRRCLRDIGFQLRLPDLGMGILLAIGGVLASAFSQGGLYLGQQITGYTWQESAANSNVLGGLSLAGIVLVLVNPVFEELLVRGYLASELSFLTRSTWLPLAVSVLLQASYHLYQGIPNVIALTACFLVWGIYFNQTRRLGPIILAHLYLDILGLLRST